MAEAQREHSIILLDTEDITMILIWDCIISLADITMPERVDL